MQYTDEEGRRCHFDRVASKSVAAVVVIVVRKKKKKQV